MNPSTSPPTPIALSSSQEVQFINPEPSTPKHNNPDTDRDTRLMIQTALFYHVSWRTIRESLQVTNRQILYAKKHRPTPQKSHLRHKKVTTPQRALIENWLHESPSHHHIAPRNIPHYLPELGEVGEKAMHSAIDLLGYCRRSSKKKGYSDDPVVCRQRLEFAREALNWTKERVMNQIFSDEVWAMGGAHTASYVTVRQDGSDRYAPENLQHKYRKLPAWMFFGTIYKGRKGPAIFWEKEWGSINSERYDEHILPLIEGLMLEYPDLIFMQDNAPSHRSHLTVWNLQRRRIRNIKWPPWAQDLNLIEHIWSWMKNWMQKHYFAAHYNPERIPLYQLKSIIWQAWRAIPDSFIESLIGSWWRRCEAVIKANGGPTRY